MVRIATERGVAAISKTIPKTTTAETTAAERYQKAEQPERLVRPRDAKCTLDCFCVVHGSPAEEKKSKESEWRVKRDER